LERTDGGGAEAGHEPGGGASPYRRRGRELGRPAARGTEQNSRLSSCSCGEEECAVGRRWGTNGGKFSSDDKVGLTWARGGRSQDTRPRMDPDDPRRNPPGEQQRFPFYFPMPGRMRMGVRLTGGPGRPVRLGHAATSHGEICTVDLSIYWIAGPKLFEPGLWTTKYLVQLNFFKDRASASSKRCI
jgi:hypothetical protein